MSRIFKSSFILLTSILLFVTCSNKKRNPTAPDHTPVDGTLKWEFKTQGDMYSSPAIGLDGSIYFGSEDDMLYALNSNGKQKWTFKADYSICSSPAIGYDGTIYIGSDDNRLYAISPGGALQWLFETGDNILSSPAIGLDGTVYVGSFDHKLYAIYADGTKRWEFETDDRVGSSPAIGEDGTIYVGSNDHKLYAINPDGSKKWEYLTGGIVGSSPAIGNDGIIYVGSGDYKLYAIKPNGMKKWSFNTGAEISSSPVIGLDGTIYVGSLDSKVYAVNPDGSKKWLFQTEDDVQVGAVIGSSGTIYIGSYDNKFYAINPDGTKKWEFLTNSWINSPPILGLDGTIYFCSHDSTVYALYSSDIPINSCWSMFHKDAQHTGRLSFDEPEITTPPHAAFNVTPQFGPLNTLFQFDASSSFDNEDPQNELLFRWDWENNGMWDTDYSQETRTTHQYSVLGLNTIKLEVKDTDGLLDTTTIEISVLEMGTVMDIDGNVYQTVKIGSQWWMAENLKVTHYQNGDAIINVTDDSVWTDLNIDAYCIYNNDKSNMATYGCLYNWYTANDNRNIAPDGWHVPSDEEWKKLEIYLGMNPSEANVSNEYRGTNEGGKIKETGTAHWNSPNIGATNISGFSALPGGVRNYGSGRYASMGHSASFWCSDADGKIKGWRRNLINSNSSIYRDANDKHFGFSVRCVMDN